MLGLLGFPLFFQSWYENLIRPCSMPGIARTSRTLVSNPKRTIFSYKFSYQEDSRLAFVTLREGEDPESLLKRFQSSMQRSGIMRELRNRRFYRSKGEQERLDRQRSIRRMRRRSRNR